VYGRQPEKSLAGFDSRQRLTVAYAVDLPVGQGKRFLNGGNAAVQKLTSGWSVSGGSTFQDGFPLGLTATPNVTGFNLGLRPNVAPGCNKTVSGSAQSRLNDWFRCCPLFGPRFLLAWRGNRHRLTGVLFPRSKDAEFEQRRQAASVGGLAPVDGQVLATRASVFVAVIEVDADELQRPAATMWTFHIGGNGM
jgi:hypothetical protein